MKIVTRNVNVPQFLIILGTLLVAIVLRAQYINFASGDYAYFLSNWVLHIRTYPMAEAYGTAFNNYAPLYSYILGFIDFYFPNIYPLHTVKLAAFIGEAIAAFWAYRITALYYRDRPGSPVPALSVAFLLMCPSVITNGSISGQCDIWLAGFMLGALYNVMVHRSAAAFFFGGLALAFKPQAIFLSPFLLVLMLHRDLNWKQFWIIPAVYLATCLPAWLEGRPLMELLTIYTSQIDGALVSHSAANPYLYLNDYSKEIPLIRQTGEVVALLIASLLAWVSYKRWHSPLTPPDCLLLATLFAAVMPFVLPIMHDRYFFMADIFSLLLTCMHPRWFILPVLLQSASLIALPGSQIPTFNGLAGWVQSLGMFNAMLMNVAAIATLLWLCHRNIWTTPQKISNQGR